MCTSMNYFIYNLVAVIGVACCGYLIYDNHKQGRTFKELFFEYEYETIESENDDEN